MFLIYNLDIFEGAESICGEKKSDESGDGGDGARVEVGQGSVVADDCHMIISITCHMIISGNQRITSHVIFSSA